MGLRWSRIAAAMRALSPGLSRFVMFASPGCCDGARWQADGHVAGADELRCTDTLKLRWIVLLATHE
jgi:hypothetical protein